MREVILKQLDFIALATTSLFVVASSHVSAHDWYIDLKAEDGISCCSMKDCHPVLHRYTESNDLEVQIGRYWIVVSSELVLSVSSPDSDAHACYYYGRGQHFNESRNYLDWELKGPIIRCVVLPGNS
jgi:hypothetical protein